MVSQCSLIYNYLIMRGGVQISTGFRTKWIPFSRKGLFIAFASLLVCWTLAFWFMATLYIFGLGLWYELQTFFPLFLFLTLFTAVLLWGWHVTLFFCSWLCLIFLLRFLGFICSYDDIKKSSLLWCYKKNPLWLLLRSLVFYIIKLNLGSMLNTSWCKIFLPN